MKVTGFRLIAGLAALAALVGGTANASVVTTLTDNTHSSAPSEVRVSIADEGDGVRISVDLLSGNTGNTGDLRGLFFDFASFDPLATYSAVGPAVTAFDTETSKIGGDNNANPLGPFDIGVEFGTSGIGKDDYQSVSFLFSVIGGKITESDFLGQSIVARVMSVGPENGERKGSSKVAGVVPEPSPVPLPASGLLIVAGLGALGALRGRRTTA